MLPRAKYWIILIGLVLGCGTKKSIPTGPKPVLSIQDIYDIIDDHNISFDWYDADADVSLDSEQLSGSGDLILRIKKDSIIWGVGKKFSIEGVRFLINPDEVQVMYRQENTYQQESLYYLERMLGMSVGFDDLQNLLVGNIFSPAHNSRDSLYETVNAYTLVSRVDGFKISYEINPYRSELKSVHLIDENNRQVKVNYNKYSVVSNQKVVTDITLEARESNKTATARIEIDELELDVPKKTPFNIPSHYERI